MAEEKENLDKDEDLEEVEYQDEDEGVVEKLKI